MESIMKDVISSGETSAIANWRQFHKQLAQRPKWKLAFKSYLWMSRDEQI